MAEHEPEAPGGAGAGETAAPQSGDAATTEAARLAPEVADGAGPPPGALLVVKAKLAQAGALLRSLPRRAGEAWVWLRGLDQPPALAQGLAALAGRTPPPRFRDVLVTVAGFVAGGVAATAGFALYVTWGMPTPRDVWSAAQSPSYTFIDRAGRVIMREGAQNAPPVDLATLPPYVPQAVIAIEDRRFYQHRGLDLNGLARAFSANVAAGRVVQGGSTLTQQLAKNLFLTNERSFRRKAQEIVLALWLEHSFSKDELLALYLSRVYFGAGAFGVEAASERYFDKPAKDLALNEAALLAALLKAPSRLNPTRQPTQAAERARVVLAEMATQGVITPAQQAAAASETLAISLSNPNGNLGYFRDWIQPVIEEALGDQRDDFIIETTLDLEAQRAGERAIADAIAREGEAKQVSQGALLALDELGAVRAMVGGVGYEQTQFNRTTQARRQPGSSFKYFIYLAAIEAGLSPWSVREDAPIVIGDWAPGNYKDEFYGLVSLGTAFAKSLNMVAIQVALEVGGNAVIELARRLGVESPLANYRSLALGAQELTLMELTSAYGALASGGKRLEPHGIAQIRRANGEVVWTWSGEREQVLDPRTVRLMNELTTRVVSAGTGTRARVEGRAIGGKTGTSNGYRDAWFVGYTPGFVAGVWFGNDNFSPMLKVTGGNLPAMAWRDFMETALQSIPPAPLPLPSEDDIPTVIEAAPLPFAGGFGALPEAPEFNDQAADAPVIDALPPAGEG